MIRDILMTAAGASAGSSSLLRGTLAKTFDDANFGINLAEIPTLQVDDLVIICVTLSGGGALSCTTAGWTDHGATNYQGRVFSKAMQLADLGTMVLFSGALQLCAIGVAAVIPARKLTLGTISTGISPPTLTPASLTLSSGSAGSAPFASMVWANCVGSVNITGSPEYTREILATQSGYPTVAMFFRNQMANGATLPCTLTFTGVANQATARQIASAT